MMNECDFKEVYVEMIGFEVPNLDTFIDPGRLAQCREEFKSIAATFSDLASYAEAKQGAMELRVKGDIAAALRFEVCGELLFKRLPDWARW